MTIDNIWSPNTKEEKVMASKIVKSCDLYGETAAKLFSLLNENKVTLKMPDLLCSCIRIVSKKEPNELVYPEGWFYCNGYLTNKNQSSSGMYDEILMITEDGDPWSEHVNYCTLN